MLYKLIVVTGCMRSGTSLLHGLVSTSPDAGPQIAPARYVADQLKIYRRYTGSDRPFASDYFSSDCGIADETIRIIRKRLDAAWANTGKPRCLVVRSVEFAPMITIALQLLPEAAFVFSVRDPKDAISSMLKVGQKQKLLGLAKSSPEMKRDIRKLCRTYNSAYLQSLRIRRKQPLLGERIAFVRYEEAAADPVSALSEVWHRFGMTSGSCKPGLLAKRPSLMEVASHRYWRTFITQLHDGPASSESVGSFRSILSEDEEKLIARRCRFVRRAFGYTDT